MWYSIEWLRVLPCVLTMLQPCAAGCAGRSNSEPADATETTIAPDPEAAYLLSALYGVDDALPLPASWLVCTGERVDDGMPVVFSRVVDLATRRPATFS